MKIIQPVVELLSITPNAEQLIELAGRTCYKSEDGITSQSSSEFITMLLKCGHESVLEHANATLKFVTDRGVTHELVRHRLCAYSQESTRYCNYGKAKFGNEISVIQPPFKKASSDRIWLEVCSVIEHAYLKLLEQGESPQIARSVLPNCLKTEIVHTANFREWRYILRLRTSDRAHPQIREVMMSAKQLLCDHSSSVFSML